MILYPNNTTKQVVDNELNKKLKKFDERIENNSSEITSLKSRVSNTEDNITSINGDIEGLEEDIGSLDTRVDTVELALEEKQDTLNFDNVPTDNSDNPVKSGGIYNALETKLDKESVKFDPEPNGTDALSTGGAYDIVQDLTEQLNDYKRNVVVQTTDADGVKKNLGAIIIDNQNEVETDKAIVVENGGTELKDTNVDGDLTSTTLAVENDATIGGDTTVNGSVTSNEFVGGLEKSISITDENNTTHTFNNTDNVSLSGVLKAQKDINGDSIDSTYVKNATKGVANGIATLDENGRLPYSQLPESAMELKGLWDASTNTPTLVQGVGTNGDFYIVSVGGTQFGENFNVNDRIVFVSDDNTWHRLPYTITSPVTSVNNKIGAVTLYGTDIQKSNSDSETITHALDNILNKVYPIGSLYWSSQSTDPSILFGGTWTQIKDCFVWAKGDNDTVNATGGAKTVTLAVANLPSHNHSFTPSGSISITTNPTFTGTEHSHTYTPQGTVSSHSHTINSGNTSSSGTVTTAGIRHSGSTGGMSGNSEGKLPTYNHSSNNSDHGNLSLLQNQYSSGSYGGIYTMNTDFKGAMKIDVSHTHTLPTSYIYGKTDNTQPTFTGTQATLKATAGGSISGGAYKFTGTAGNTGSKGNGDAVDKMPPYVVKYCWERTA